MKILILVLSVSMAFFVSAQQLPSGFLPSPFSYYYNAAALSTTKTNAAVANPVSSQGNTYHDYTPLMTLGSHVVLLTKCLKELNDTNEKFAHMSTGLGTTNSVVEQVMQEIDEIKRKKDVLFENLRKEMNVNNQRLVDMTQQLSKNTLELTDAKFKVETFISKFDATNNELTSTKTKMEVLTSALDDTKQQLAEAKAAIAVLKVDLNVTKQDLTNERIKIGDLTTEVKKSLAASSIGKIPSSCGDLQQIGHKKSGLYLIMGNKQVESAYCDFTKPTGDTGLQKWIGFANVKSTFVFFYALRNSPFNQANVPIPFESEKLNIGGGMNLASGIFTAPVKGVYFFSFTGLASFPDSSSKTLNLKIAFYLNGSYLSTAEVGEANTVQQSSSLTMQATINMQKRDQIWLKIWEITTGVYMWDSNYHHSHFTGFLLYEEMSVSL